MERTYLKTEILHVQAKLLLHIDGINFERRLGRQT